MKRDLICATRIRTACPFIQLEKGIACLPIIVCVEVLWPSQPNGVISRAVSLPDHRFTGQA